MVTSPASAPDSRDGAGFLWPLGALAARAPAATPPPSIVGMADLRGANAAAVLAAVRRTAPPPRVATLVETTKLSRPTVEVILEDLMTCGLVAPATESGATPRGRPARRFQFQPDAGYVVGVSVRSRSVTACITDLEGRVVQRSERAVRRDLTGGARAKAVLEVVERGLHQAKVERSRVCAAVVGTPGWVEANTRVRYVDNLKDWADVDIAGMLGESLSCPVALENDANLAALGEHWRGVGQAATDLVFVLLGERVGAGIIAGGHPLHGYQGAAGEIGFMVFRGGNTLAARAIGDVGKQRPGIDPASIYSDEQVVRAAADGDRKAIAALESVGSRLAEALAPVLLALDPMMVVLGTSLFALPDLDAASGYVLEAAERRSATLLVDPPEWRLSSLGDDVILTGAARFALAAVEEILLTRPTTLFD